MSSRRLSSRTSLLQSRARQMREAPTGSEATLWAALRGNRLGVAFRRQAVIGPHIVDFLAPSVRLVIEVDGAYHALRERADARRERYLQRAGYSVLRFSSDAVLHAIPNVLAAIALAVREG